MKPINHLFLAGSICSALFIVSEPHAQDISGMASLELIKPATQKQKDMQRSLALDSLKSSLTIWVNEFFNKCLDPQNAVSKYFLDIFIEKCISKAKEKSFVEGREFTVEFTIPNATLDMIIATHNTHYDSLTLHYWNIFSEAQKHNRGVVLFKAGLQALFYSKARIGSPLDIKGVPTGMTLPQHLQAAMQKIINRLDFTFSEPIITGKPPHYPQKEVTITVSLDSIPVTNFPIVIQVPGGKTIFSAMTNSSGVVSLAKLRIPFVAHGAFIYVRPNFGAIINPKLSLTTASFGLKSTENIDQTLICNIIQPIFTLDYTATPVNDVTIPPVFSDQSKVIKFFTDSLHLKTHTGSQQPDLAFKLNCQISSYTSDEKEETQMKVEVKAVVQDLETKGRVVEKVAVLNDKKYDSNHKIPIGLFFWESSVALHSLIKQMLDEL